MRTRIIKYLILNFTLIFILTGCAEIKAPNADITSMFIQLQHSLPYIKYAIVGLSYLCGIFFIYVALMKLKVAGSQTMMSSAQAHFSGPMIKLFAGAILMIIPSTINITTATLWGKDSLLRYDYIGILPGGQDIEKSILDIIIIVGYVAFVRGLIMLKHSAQQGAPHGIFGKGSVHFVGGLLSINIVGTIDVIKHTLNL